MHTEAKFIVPREAEYQKNPEHHNNYQREWCKQHRPKLLKQARDRHRAYREQAIALYGGKCNCCGISTYEFLAIDHIKGGGTKERKEKWPNSQSFYRWIKENYVPDVYQILCHNCNSANGYYGYCPHQKKTS